MKYQLFFAFSLLVTDSLAIQTHANGLSHSVNPFDHIDETDSGESFDEKYARDMEVAAA